MIIKVGRFGRFLACSAYPACKTTQPLSIGVTCPQPDCGGSISERHTKKGKTFYSCGNYPKCNFMSWNRPINQTCTQCNSNYMVEKWSKKMGKYQACPVCKNIVQLEKKESA
jgi:DNA topoisomerase-1